MFESFDDSTLAVRKACRWGPSSDLMRSIFFADAARNVAELCRGEVMPPQPKREPPTSAPLPRPAANPQLLERMGLIAEDG